VLPRKINMFLRATIEFYIMHKHAVFPLLLKMMLTHATCELSWNKGRRKLTTNIVDGDGQSDQSYCPFHSSIVRVFCCASFESVREHQHRFWGDGEMMHWKYFWRMNPLNAVRCGGVCAATLFVRWIYSIKSYLFVPC
jgi:hypothetical protein